MGANCSGARSWTFVFYRSTALNETDYRAFDALATVADVFTAFLTDAEDLDLAKHIVEQKSSHFEPDKFEDHYEAAST